jgi:hypothetical protein
MASRRSARRLRASDTDGFEDIVEPLLVQHVVRRQEHRRQNVDDGGVVLLLRFDQHHVEFRLELIAHDRSDHIRVCHNLRLGAVFWNLFGWLGVGVDRLQSDRGATGQRCAVPSSAPRATDPAGGTRSEFLRQSSTKSQMVPAMRLSHASTLTRCMIPFGSSFSFSSG